MSPRQTQVLDLAYGDLIDGLDVLSEQSATTGSGTSPSNTEGDGQKDLWLAKRQFWVFDKITEMDGGSVTFTTINSGTWTVHRTLPVAVHGSILRESTSTPAQDEPATTPAEDPEAVKRAVKAHRAISPTIASVWGNEGIDEAAMQSALYAALTDKQTPDQQGLRETLVAAARDAGNATAKIASDSARTAAKGARDFLIRQAFKDRSKD